MSTDQTPETIDRPASEKPDVPRAVEDNEELSRHGDPSLTKPDPTKKAERKPGRGVVWTRPTDLLSHAGGRISGCGIDFQAELTRRTRRVTVQAAATRRHAISERAHRLSPLSAFGNRRTPPAQSVGRPGIGTR
ncbi:hypothetical protein [Glaciibacter superstes]|uniref:hypothetical protein n=1 Tax=Glaciibacter superstes TaxID=501023 RepID=UPI0003B51216|nr:hypothetical protein [Glaciibacter superstes]